MELDTIITQVQALPFFAKQEWKWANEAIEMGSLRWRPDFVNQFGVMAVINSDTIPNFLHRRIKAAYLAGLRITCVARLSTIAHTDTMRALSEVDSDIAFINENDEISPPEPLLKVLGEQELGIEASERMVLITQGIERCANATTNHQKGLQLECLLHFMFSQIQDFRVLKCNWRTRTEELDCVVQIRPQSGVRCWSNIGAPYIIVEAKNRNEKAGQEIVGKLKSIMDGKRGFCRIGVIVSLSGFSSDAHNQVLRFSSEDKTFVLIDKADLLALAKEKDLDEGFERLINKAMLN